MPQGPYRLDYCAFGDLLSLCQSAADGWCTLPYLLMRAYPADPIRPRPHNTIRSRLESDLALLQAAGVPVERRHTLVYPRGGRPASGPTTMAMIRVGYLAHERRYLTLPEIYHAVTAYVHRVYGVCYYLRRVPADLRHAYEHPDQEPEQYPDLEPVKIEWGRDETEAERRAFPVRYPRPPARPRGRPRKPR